MIELDLRTSCLLFFTLLSLIAAGHIVVLSLICSFSHSLEIQVIIQKVNACLLVFQTILAAALIVLYICRPDPTSSSDQADDSKIFELQMPPPVELHRRDQK